MMKVETLHRRCVHPQSDTNHWPDFTHPIYPEPRIPPAAPGTQLKVGRAISVFEVSYSILFPGPKPWVVGINMSLMENVI